jgi:hypothetical protein
MPTTRPHRRTRVYVAGPYTGGDVAQNVARAMDVADELLSAGFAPFCPHLSHFLHLHHPHGYETWMDLDMAWLAACDVVLRLPGVSPGADREVAEAEALGIPVAYLSAAQGANAADQVREALR